MRTGASMTVTLGDGCKVANHPLVGDGINGESISLGADDSRVLLVTHVYSADVARMIAAVYEQADKNIDVRSGLKTLNDEKDVDSITCIGVEPR